MSISVTELGSLLDHTGRIWKRKSISPVLWRRAELYGDERYARPNKIVAGVCRACGKVRYLLIVLLTNRWRIC